MSSLKLTAFVVVLAVISSALATTAAPKTGGKARAPKEIKVGHLKPGDPAPSFSLDDQNGRLVKLADFKGQKLLVYFYPKADTPGCTKQACSVRDHRQDLTKLGLAVVGISPDTPDRQKKFDEKYQLGFPLLSDRNHAVAEAWGVWGEKTFMGKRSLGIIRSSFLVDAHGRLANVWYNVKPEETVPEAQKALAAAG